MDCVSKLKKCDGHFDNDDYFDHQKEYDDAFAYLVNNKEYALAYKSLKRYMELFKEADQTIFTSYRPGMDYDCNFFALYHYALMNEKGVKGVVERNKEEAGCAYLLLLKRFEQLPDYIKDTVIKKSHILLKCAYPDANDRYSEALNAAGQYLYERGEYKKAFRLFKKGADFNCDGRQIIYPYYLIAINQDSVGNMYRDGLGVEQNMGNAIKYYRKCSENCGRRYNPKLAFICLAHEDYFAAFLCLTETNPRFRYDCYFFFLDPDEEDMLYEEIFNGLLNKKDKNNNELAALAFLYKYGLGCQKNEEEYQELLPKDVKWFKEWCQDYEKQYGY